jgi:HSP20 family protein
METRTLVPTYARRGLLAPFANLREEMDKLFNDWLKEVNFEPLRLFEGDLLVPRVDAYQHEKFLEIVAELPGITAKEVTLELTKDTLILAGEKKMVKEEKEEGTFRRERRFGAFNRVIPLPFAVDVAKTAVEATFKNGILTVKVPLPEGAIHASKKIAINA